MIKEYIPIRDNINFKFQSNGFNLLVSIMAVILIAVYLFGVINFLNHGHHAFGVTREHPWGFLVAAYEFFVAVSMGSIAIASAGLFFNIEIIKPLIKRLLPGMRFLHLSGAVSYSLFLICMDLTQRLWI